MATSTDKAPAIAVIGLSCRYPGAKNIKELWENVLARRRQFRRNPDNRLPLSNYFDPDPKTPDKTYGEKIAVIDGFEFDWVKHAIPKITFESTDIVHWLALNTAICAIENAGYSRKDIPTPKTGVIVGNTMAGEWTRSELIRLRWPFVARAIREAAAVENISLDVVANLLETTEAKFKSVFPPITEDSLAGHLSNTIAGRICNYFNFNGGGYTVDGACSSSLIAVATGATALSNGDLDIAIVGGVDISLDPFELVGFAKTGALSSGDMNVYDKAAAGFIPGEGCGFAVLKRLEDAEKDGDFIYSVIRGWGISSDGKGGITAPKAESQAISLERAYERAGFSPHELSFIEGHGTGTTVGDVAELTGIASAMKKFGEPAEKICGVTSLKSIIGHTKAASGIAGFIKTAIAVNRRVLPPTAGCTNPNPIFDEKANCIYPILEGEIINPNKKIKAGVSSMGFGGINCHIAIESGAPPAKSLDTEIPERTLMFSSQDAELFVFSANSVSELKEKINSVRDDAFGIAECELTDLAAALTKKINFNDKIKAAFIADSVKTFQQKIDELDEKVKTENDGLLEDLRAGIFIGDSMDKHRVAFLFPGQGSQQINMSKILVERYEWARDFLNRADAILTEAGIKNLPEKMFKNIARARGKEETKNWLAELTKTKFAQPAICLASFLTAEYLGRLGIKPQAVCGHSLGELSAFCSAGGYDFDFMMRLVAARAAAMADIKKEGAMCALMCDKKNAENIIENIKKYVVIANINSPKQTIISGDVEAIDEAMKRAADKKIRAKKLPVSNAFHSDFVKEAADALAKDSLFKDSKKLKNNVKIISSTNGKIVDKNTNLRDHFSNQIISQVDFISTIKTITEYADVLIETGPGRVLSSLASASVKTTPCLPVESTAGSVKDLLSVVASFFVRGGKVNWDALFENRLVREFVPPHQKKFIENPCERPFSSEYVTATPLALPSVSLERELAELVNVSSSQMSDYLSKRRDFIAKVIQADIQTLPNISVPSQKETPADSDKKIIVKNDIDSISNMLIELVVDHTGFPKESISLSSKLLDDLNLDSIKASSMIGEAVSNLGIAGKIDPSLFVNSKLEKIAETLERVVNSSNGENEKAAVASAAAPKNSWVKILGSKFVSEPLADIDSDYWKNRNALIISDENDNDTATTLAQLIKKQECSAEIISYHSAAKFISEKQNNFSDFILLLPKNIKKFKNANEHLRSAINLIHPITTVSKPDATVCFVKFDAESEKHAFEISAVNALCATIHLEHPEMKSRVLSFPKDADNNSVAEKILDELAAKISFDNAKYNSKFDRFSPKVFAHNYDSFSERFIAWSPNDVIIVTGGAKGITAECALALANATGAKMALVGSSPPAPDNPQNEINKNLKRFSDAGIKANYYQCDITNAAEVEKLIKNISSSFGNISGIVHGAALNIPKILEEVTFEHAYKEVAPKILGILNLLHSLENKPLKLLVGMSSIIGVSGMIRNGWYGFSNESLDCILSNYRREHPGAAVVSIAFSVWDEVGMGVKLGSAKFLAKSGIDAIPVKKGVQKFLDLVEYDTGDVSAIVSARLEGLDTIRPFKFPLPKANRFLENVVLYYPRIELVARAKLTLDTDDYLKDHVWQGAYLFPTVFGLEAMAQAASYVSGFSDFSNIKIENITLEKPIVVNKNSGATIEINAIVLEQNSKEDPLKIKCSISTEETGFSDAHFSAIFVFDSSKKSADNKINPPKNPLDIDFKRDIYGPLLFQGEKFQKLQNVFEISNEKCVFATSIDKNVDSTLLLGDPFFRDTLLQATQLLAPQAIALPVAIDKIERFAQAEKTGGISYGIATARNSDINAKEQTADVFAYDANGNLIEILSGYKAKVLNFNLENPTAEDFIDPSNRDEKILISEVSKRAEFFKFTPPKLAAQHLLNAHKLPKEKRHKIEEKLIAKIIGDNLKISWDKNGKPVCSDKNIHLSVTHDDFSLVAVAGNEIQGCDIEPVASKTESEWQALLSASGKKLLEKLVAEGENINIAGTRIWTAVEAVWKAENSKNITLEFPEMNDDNFIFKATVNGKNFKVLTFPVKLTLAQKRMFALVIASF